MNPQTVFGQCWQRALCVSLSMHRLAIMDYLGEQGDGERFLDDLDEWSERYRLKVSSPSLSEREREEACLALWNLCEQYGVVRFLVDNGLAGATAREAEGEQVEQLCGKEPAPCLGERHPSASEVPCYWVASAVEEEADTVGLLARLVTEYGLR